MSSNNFMNNCPNCGAPLNPNSPVCEYCGSINTNNILMLKEQLENERIMLQHKLNMWEIEVELNRRLSSIGVINYGELFYPRLS